MLKRLGNNKQPYLTPTEVKTALVALEYNFEGAALKKLKNPDVNLNRI